MTPVVSPPGNCYSPVCWDWGVIHHQRLQTLQCIQPGELTKNGRVLFEEKTELKNLVASAPLKGQGHDIRADTVVRFYRSGLGDDSPATGTPFSN